MTQWPRVFAQVHVLQKCTCAAKQGPSACSGVGTSAPDPICSVTDSKDLATAAPYTALQATFKASRQQFQREYTVIVAGPADRAETKQRHNDMNQFNVLNSTDL